MYGTPLSGSSGGKEGIEIWQVSVKDCAGVLRYSEMNTIIVSNYN